VLEEVTQELYLPEVYATVREHSPSHTLVHQLLVVRILSGVVLEHVQGGSDQFLHFIGHVTPLYIHRSGEVTLFKILRILIDDAETLLK
jgi:hypothetical protein